MAISLARFLQQREPGTEDPVRRTIRAEPWSWRTDDGVYGREGRPPWLYWVLPTEALDYENTGKVLRAGQRIESLLAALGELSPRPPWGIKTLANNREIHLLSVAWDDVPTPPPDAPPKLRAYLAETFEGHLDPRKTFFIGIQLRATGKAVLGSFSNLVSAFLDQDALDLTPYEDDIRNIQDILKKHDARPPTRIECRQLESWYNGGQGACKLIDYPDRLSVPSWHDWEMAVVMRFGQSALHAPDDQWAAIAMSHYAPASVLSVRAELEPPEITRNRARSAQRKLIASLDEQAESQDLERGEDHEALQLARMSEDYVRTVATCTLANASIVFARARDDSVRSYLDDLYVRFGIEAKVLEDRQHVLMTETLPCSLTRVNPFVQDLSLSMLAYSGMGSFGGIGDPTGLHLGISLPEGRLCYVDPGRASRGDAVSQVPAMGIFAEPGGGKTVLMQHLAVQAKLAGLRTIFVNPKGYDSLESMLTVVSGTQIRMSVLAKKPGALDPYTFGLPDAAEILTQHILGVLEELTELQELSLTDGLSRAVRAKARCAGEALRFIDDEEVVKRVLRQAESSPMFSLAISPTPQPALALDNLLTLIEFDRQLNLPHPGKTNPDRSERIALAALRLVTRMSMEILMRPSDNHSKQGGVFLLDEAYEFLSHPESLSFLQRLGRQARSQRVFPIFATHRAADLVDANIEEYLGRVLVMRMGTRSDTTDAEAALKLCGYDPTPEKVAALANFGPRDGHGPTAFHRDLDDRHGRVLLATPLIPRVLERFGTSSAHKEARESAQASARLKNVVMEGLTE